MILIFWNEKECKDFPAQLLARANFIAYAYDVTPGKVKFYILKNRWGASDYRVTKTGLINLLRKAI